MANTIKYLITTVLLMTSFHAYSAEEEDTATGRLSRIDNKRKRIGVVTVDDGKRHVTMYYQLTPQTVIKNKSGQIVEIRKLMGRQITVILADKKVISATENK